MSVVALYHVQLAVRAGGVDRARDFYGRLRGVTERAKPASLENRGGCSFETGPVKVLLGVGASFVNAGKVRPTFFAEDVCALQSKLEGVYCGIVEDEPLEGYDRLDVCDPLGNRIELMQPLAA
jgi:catechol 2,3-dioxygenase-like lactoylglutathione lyase family enzyme